MLDEVTVYARLDSELYGSFAHAVEVSARAVEADAAAARLYNGPDASVTTYVMAGRLGLSAAEEEALQQWPRDPGSLFEFLESRRLTDGVFRPREAVDEVEYARHPLYRRFEACTRVCDAFCLCFPVDGAAWCALGYLRCGSSRPFDDASLSRVERLKPALARLVQRGLQREATPRAVELRAAGDLMVHAPVPTARLLAKLSKTERHVLGYLRSNMTERTIAQELGRSPHTVHVHVKNIYRKLGVTCRKDLLRLFNE